MNYIEQILVSVFFYLDNVEVIYFMNEIQVVFQFEIF